MTDASSERTWHHLGRCGRIPIFGCYEARQKRGFVGNASDFLCYSMKCDRADTGFISVILSLYSQWVGEGLDLMLGGSRGSLNVCVMNTAKRGHAVDVVDEPGADQANVDLSHFSSPSKV